jgi:hypothetical protein
MPLGINDAGQVVGFYATGANCTGAGGAVIYNQGNFTSYLYSGNQSTDLQSINGDAQIVGSYYASNGFWDSFHL